MTRRPPLADAIPADAGVIGPSTDPDCWFALRPVTAKVPVRWFVSGEIPAYYGTGDQL